jgi:long-chain fatty acid transport protein
MKFLTKSLLISSLISTNIIYAAAFQYYELGTPIIGTAAVGQAVIANDASTAYFNPANMTSLNASQLMLGSEILIPFTKFNPDNETTIPGDNGGEAATLLPGMSLFYVYSYSPQLKFGVSLTSPYGGMLNYDDGWVGRYNVQQTQFYTLNLNPALAYQFNKMFAVGGGFSVEYANVYQTTAFPLPLDLPPPLEGPVEGQATVKTHNTAFGLNVGVLFTPYPSTKIGLAYRSQIKHDLKGDTEFLRTLQSGSTKTQMIMPQNIILSVDQKIYQQFDLLAELGWANWSTMKDAIVDIEGFTTTTELDWNDTYRVGVAGQYHVTPNLLLQTGVSYDSSPTSRNKRTPDLPMDRQIRAGIGVIYSIMRMIQIGFSYEYVNLGNADIYNRSSNGVLSGSYSKNYLNVLQASVSVSS